MKHVIITAVITVVFVCISLVSINCITGLLPDGRGETFVTSLPEEETTLLIIDDPDDFTLYHWDSIDTRDAQNILKSSVIPKDEIDDVEKTINSTITDYLDVYFSSHSPLNKAESFADSLYYLSKRDLYFIKDYKYKNLSGMTDTLSFVIENNIVTYFQLNTESNIKLSEDDMKKSKLAYQKQIEKFVSTWQKAFVPIDNYEYWADYEYKEYADEILRVYFEEKTDNKDNPIYVFWKNFTQMVNPISLEPQYLYMYNNCPYELFSYQGLIYQTQYITQSELYLRAGIGGSISYPIRLTTVYNAVSNEVEGFCLQQM